MALDGVSFEVERGDILGFLGPNGAGKSTTMKIVCGFIPATSGTAIVEGFDVRTHSIDARRQIGYLPENTPLYTDMRVREYLEFRARMKGVERREVATRVDYVLERTRIADRKRQLIGTLSKGYRQRVGIADALVSDPPLLVLDEPTIGLDPGQVREVRQLVKELGAQHTIVLSTHILSEVEIVCTKVVIIANGRSRAQNTVKGLVESERQNAIRVSIRAKDGTLDEVEKALLSVPGVKAAHELSRDDTHPTDVVGFRLEIEGARGDEAATRAAAERIAARVLEKGWALRELAVEQTTLEEIFMSLTRDDPGASPQEASPAPASAPAAGGNGQAPVLSTTEPPSPAPASPAPGETAGGGAQVEVRS
ncbi:ATP-binding cassette domain-containing protein [bacterium]|nr:ATP-binding cassette domain-containing protein [bacterium]